MADPVIEQRLQQLQQRLYRTERQVADQQKVIAALPSPAEDDLQQRLDAAQRQVEDYYAQRDRDDQKFLAAYRETGLLPDWCLTYGVPQHLAAQIEAINASWE